MNHSTTSASAVQDCDKTARSIVAKQLQSIACQADRMFAFLMAMQWIAAIVLALWLTPTSWEGDRSSIHPHVWTAIFLGGSLAAFPIYLAIFFPGRQLTRNVIAVAQMIWSALLIHLTGGRIETHFHVFGSLAFLAWYRSPSVLMVATIVVSLDHFMRGLWWPQSVYGVTTAPIVRTLEHAFWVIFEDVFLCLSIRCSLADMRNLSLHQARMEHAHELIENEVQLRTQELRLEIEGRKQVESQLALRDEQLRQAQKLEAVGSLAGGIAHEFNNLLQAIRGYTLYALEGLSAEEQRYQDLQQVVKASDRAATLTRDLLGFSRRQVLERQHVGPAEVVADFVKMLRPLIGERIDLRVTLEQNCGVLYADPGLLQQMMLNLCINARDAMPHGGQLFIKVNRVALSKAYCEMHPMVKAGNYVLFTVADTGCGIAAEVKDRIFEPFFTTKGVGKGTGLGLAMVYGCVQQHRGMINVYSEPGLGTTFKIYLPVEDDEANTDNAPLEQPPMGGTETILFAEDEPMVRAITTRILKQAGYTVVAAADGAEAVALYREHASDIAIVLLDAIMPKMTGHEAYDQIRLINPDIPVLFCSGYDPDTSQVNMLMIEGAPMVQKPFDPTVLLQTIRNVIDKRKTMESHLCPT